LTVPGKGGRPRKELDVKLFETLCLYQCTQEEIAAKMEMDADTLALRVKEVYGKRFSEVFKEKKKAGTISLRAAQFQKAIKEKNPTMQIWLGKQYLGQTDKIDASVQLQRPAIIKKLNGEVEILDKVNLHGEEIESDHKENPTEE